MNLTAPDISNVSAALDHFGWQPNLDDILDARLIADPRVVDFNRIPSGDSILSSAGAPSGSKARTVRLPDRILTVAAIPVGTADVTIVRRNFQNSSGLRNLLLVSEHYLRRRPYIDGALLIAESAGCPVSPSARNLEVPTWLETIILKCLEVDRERRYADAARVAFDLRNPEQVVIVEPRPTRRWWDRLLAAFQKRDDHLLTGAPTARRRQAGPALILAAVDLADRADPLANAVLAETGRLLATRADSRLVCLTVLKTEILREDVTADSTGRSVYIKRLVALKTWASPLGLAEERISYHVVQAVSAADAILHFAEHNQIGHIVLGARGASALRRHLGSVSSKVVAEAGCSVTVVRNSSSA